MLEADRIKEAQSNVKIYLIEGLLKKIKTHPEILRILIGNSKESLKVAEILYKNDYSDLWTIVCSYYSMYYIARAALYKNGYKVGEKISHKVTADALIAYIRNKLKDVLIKDYEAAKYEALDVIGLRTDEIIESFDFERIKRSRFQYKLTEAAKKNKAKTSLERARKFVFEMEKLLQ